VYAVVEDERRNKQHKEKFRVKFYLKVERQKRYARPKQDLRNGNRYGRQKAVYNIRQEHHRQKQQYVFKHQHS